MGSRRHPSLALATLLALAMPALADSSDPIAVEVGTATITVSEVQRRLAAIPDFQRRTFGATSAEIRRHFVDAVLVPELLFAEYARQSNLAASPRVRHRLHEALERALGESLLSDASAAAVKDDELRAYYDAHRDDYEKPERIRVARILVGDEALARRILTESTGTKGPERWKELAREHSLDAATKLRSGMLGFVYPDGRTDIPQVAVDPALYEAAAKVKDGDLVPAPIKEAGHFAAVWRRGSLPSTSRTFEEERGAIRAILVRERAERAFVTLREGLRQQNLKDENSDLIDTLSPDSLSPAPAQSGGPAGATMTSAEPAQPPAPAPAAAQPVPQPGARGLR